MNKLWRVAIFEYIRNVFKKSFLFSLLSIPCGIAFSIGLGLFLESSRNTSLPIGIVDQTGAFCQESLPPEIQSIWTVEEGQDSILAFESDEAARTALEANEIQAYFILPEHYLLTRHVEVIYINEPGSNAWRWLYNLIRFNLLSGQPPQIAYRAVSGIDFTVRSIDGRREVPAASGPTFGLMMPLFVAMAFMFMLLMSSGYTMSAITDEKENRTLEVLFTTVSPQQLIGGKILGIVAISLTLLLTWSGMTLLGILVARGAGVRWFSDLSMDWRSVIAVVAIAIPAYVLATALMTAIGVMVATSQEGQSVSGIFFILHFAPMYFAILFLKDPHSTLAVLLSVMPFTSLITVGVRNLFTIVPTWQVVVGIAVQMLCALGAIWLASNAFHFGMLRYGQRLDFRHLFRQGR